MNGMPEWLVVHLTAIGRYDTDGVRRGARLSRCSQCRRQVLSGLDGDRCAMAVTCEPYEIDEKGEALALMLGLQTYTLTQTNGAKGVVWNIDWRASNVLGRSRRYALVAEHRCEMAVPPTQDQILGRRGPVNAGSAPPF